MEDTIPEAPVVNVDYSKIPGMEELANQPAQPAQPGEPPVPQVPPTPPATSPAEPAQPGSFDYARFGVENDEQLISVFGEHKGYKEKYDALNTEFGTLKQQWDEVAPVLNTLPYLKNPFANQNIHQLNTFVSKTGISDLRFASDVLSTTDEQLKADPLLAIAIAEGLQNPEMAGLGTARLIRGAAIESGIDPSTPKDELSEDDLLKLDLKAARAMKVISEKKSEWTNSEDYFISSQAKEKADSEARQTRIKEWQKAVPQVLSGFSEVGFEFEVEGLGKVPVKVALSSQEVEEAFREVASQMIQSLNPDEAGIQKLKSNLTDRLRSAKALEAIKAAYKYYDDNHKAVVEQKLRQERHNGAPPIEQGGKTPDGTIPLDEARSAILEMIKGPAQQRLR